MNAVSFSFSPASSEADRQAALVEIRGWNEVEKAELLRPGAQNLTVQRMAFAYAADGCTADRLADKLSALPAVEAASVPALRRMAGVAAEQS